MPHFQSQQKHFSSFIKVMVEKFSPEQIYCFGKKLVLNEESGCFIDDNTDVQYHYFLLVITESNTRIEHEMQEFANTRFIFGSMTVLAHGKQTIAEAVAGNNRFFKTVFSKAQLIYCHDGMANAELIPPFIPTRSAIKAQKHFDYRIALADGFLTGACECLNNEQFNVCVFMLHQVVEQSCIGLIRVYLAYRSDIHNLHRLLRLCSSFSDKPTKMFLSGSKEDERLFDILIKSYSSARYRDNFNVSVEDAGLLFNRVTAFVALVKEMCDHKIETLKQEAELYKQLIQESEASNDFL